MFEKITKFYNDLHKDVIKITNKKLGKVIKKYLFYAIQKNEEINQDQRIQESIKNSETIIIDHYQEDNNDDNYFFISFKETIMIINQSELSCLQTFFTNNSKLPIYFLTNCKCIFNSCIKIPKSIQFEIDKKFSEEIQSFNIKSLIINPDESLTKIIEITSSLISGYLIKQGYAKSEKRQVINFNANINKFTVDEKNKIWKKDEYVELGIHGQGSSFAVELIYHIEKEELFVVKKSNGISNEDFQKLTLRQLSIFSKFNYPFLPKLYGKIKDNTNEYLVVQFINGQTLQNIQNIHLNEKEKMTIIFEIMLIINYFHQNKFVYRDLKPDNIMIDKNKTVFIIDFDSCKEFNEFDESSENEFHTCDFESIFTAPEIGLGKLTDKSDIYSIGQMIYYIMNEKFPTKNPMASFDVREAIDLIYKLCIDENYINRPSILDLVFLFYSHFNTEIETSIIKDDIYLKYIQKNFLSQFRVDKFIYYLEQSANKNHLGAQNVLGSIYLNGKYRGVDINKSIYYYTQAANQNDSDSQCQLGFIYSYTKYNKFDIDKAIYYFTLAANQNHSEAQYFLGYIYSNKKYNKFDIDKSIYYFTQAANQNHSEAQYLLGYIYSNKEYNKFDINKSINYLTQAANQNHLEAQLSLGMYYYYGNFIQRNINKAIHYLTYAADQNLEKAQFELGMIYYEGKYIQRNINKAIHYLAYAADQNLEKAQFELGMIYYEGKYIQRDINKAIQYLADAANQNLEKAQFELGMIYYEGKYIQRDINKAIHYLTNAANQNLEKAQFELGMIYYEGKYIQRDINKAIQYFAQSSKQHNKYAQFNLGIIYECIKRNIDKAIYFYTLSANQNFSQAHHKLAEIYYVKRDINKCLKHLIISANQNYKYSQTFLGFLYFNGQYITKDITRAKYYFTLAANQNHALAQYNLACIYRGESSNQDYGKQSKLYFQIKSSNKGKVKYYYKKESEDKSSNKNMEKAIYYYKLAANQNLDIAQLNLGYIYYFGNDKQDINKSIYYFTLAANKNNLDAIFILGSIYYDGLFVPKDLNKAIYYLTIAANRNHAEAQYYLGLYYSTGNYTKNNMNRALNFFVCSANNRSIKSHFVLGYFYHEGKYIKKDIKKAIFYYKEASSFNNQYAKNNLGIIYKNGFGNSIQQNIGYAKEYFNEAYGRFKDVVSMYNLANIYLYNEKKIDESIYLLIKSAKNRFYPSQNLLCIALIIKYGFDIEKIRKKLLDKTKYLYDFPNTICGMIIKQNLIDESNFKKQYEIYEKIDFLYDFTNNPVPSNKIIQEKPKCRINTMMHDISNQFYEGFGIEI